MQIEQSFARALDLLHDVYTYPCFKCTHPEPRFCAYRGRKCVNQSVRYRGVYPDYATAVAHLPSHQPAGFDNEEVADRFMERFFEFNPQDYPILLRLSQILETGNRIFDLGGGFGQCFYAYQQHIRFPQDITWQVCDLAAFTQIGMRLARTREAFALRFTDDPQRADGADVYLTNGALQYLEQDLSTLLSELPNKPAHVLINRVPLYDGEPFFTIQLGTGSYTPYKVMNVAQFVVGMESLGYRKLDQWNLPRTLRVPFQPEHRVNAYQGFYFVRDSGV